MDSISITTQSGLKIHGSSDDKIVGYKKSRFYKRNDRGYLPEEINLDQFTIDDRVAIPMIRENFTPTSYGEDVAWVLGIWLGDGCMPGQMYKSGEGRTLSVDFGGDEKESLNKYMSITQSWGDKGVVIPHKTANLITVKHHARNSPKCFSLVDKFGLTGKSAYNKEIPPEVFTMPDNEVYEFIGGMWQTDGCFMLKSHGDNKKSRWIAEWCSVSENMARAFHSLLFSVGIPSTIRSSIPTYTYKGEKKKGARAYKVCVGGADKVARFNELVTLTDYKRGNQLKSEIEISNTVRGYSRLKDGVYFDKINKIEKVNNGN